MYTTKHAQILFRVASPQTVRNWTKEFSSYLSPGATPGSGRTRYFTVEDMTVMALIAEMSDSGRPFDDIHAALASGQRGDEPAISPDEVDTLAVGEVEQALTTQLQESRELVQKLEGEIGHLKDQIQPLHDENIRLKAQLEASEDQISRNRSEVDSLREQDRERQKEIIDLHRQIARLEIQLEMLKGQDRS